jgi:hypothetical protein
MTGGGLAFSQLERRSVLRLLSAALVLVSTVLLAAPAGAQQIVETSTGKHVAGSCSVSQAILTAIQDAGDTRQAETKTRVNAFLNAALARPKSRSVAQSPVVFPPRPGS